MVNWKILLLTKTVHLSPSSGYADDNTLSKSDKDVKVLTYKLSIDSQTAIKWFKDNFMKAIAPNFQVDFFSRDKDIEGITI